MTAIKSALQQAQELFAAKDYAAARHALLAAAAQEPDSIAAHYGLGEVSLALDDPHSAVPYFQRVLDHNPALVNAWRGLGRAYEALGNREGARGAYERAVRQDPSEHYSRQRLAVLAQSQHDRADQRGNTTGQAQRASAPTGTPAAPAAVPQPANRHEPTRIRDGYVGTAAEVKAWSEQTQTDPLTAYSSSMAKPTHSYLSFDLITDAGEIFSVELRGRQIKGIASVKPGVRVAVPFTMDKTGTLRVKTVEVIHGNGSSHLVEARGAGALANTGRAVYVAVVALAAVGVVALFVSDVFDGRAADPPPSTIVPRVRGLPASTAIDRLRAAGLQVDQQREPSAIAPAGRVIKALPMDGTHVHDGDNVTLIVSRGSSRVNVPNPVGAPASPGPTTTTTSPTSRTSATSSTTTPTTTTTPTPTPTQKPYVTPRGDRVPGSWRPGAAIYARATGMPYRWIDGQHCDQNIFAGDRTSCAFADNIFAVVAAARHYDQVTPESLKAYSPATARTYAVTCTEYRGNDKQTDVQCITANGAGATFPVSAAAAYYQ